MIDKIKNYLETWFLESAKLKDSQMEYAPLGTKAALQIALDALEKYGNPEEYSLAAELSYSIHILVGDKTVGCVSEEAIRQIGEKLGVE